MHHCIRSSTLSEQGQILFLSWHAVLVPEQPLDLVATEGDQAEDDWKPRREKQLRGLEEKGQVVIQKSSQVSPVDYVMRGNCGIRSRIVYCLRSK